MGKNHNTSWERTHPTEGLSSTPWPHMCLAEMSAGKIIASSSDPAILPPNGGRKWNEIFFFPSWEISNSMKRKTNTASNSEGNQRSCSLVVFHQWTSTEIRYTNTCIQKVRNIQGHYLWGVFHTLFSQEEASLPGSWRCDVYCVNKYTAAPTDSLDTASYTNTLSLGRLAFS